MCLECQPPAPCRYPDWGLLLQLRGEDRTSVTELQNLLKQTAEVYRSLVQHAKAASVPVPPEAQLGTGVKRGPDQLEYDEFAAANATDWDDFQDEGMGCLSGCAGNAGNIC
jgi:hypothetical protein